MNSGIVFKAMRELAVVTGISGLALFVVHLVFAWILPGLIQDFAPTMLQVGFIRNIVRAVFGAEVAGHIDPRLLAVMPWAHPIGLAILSAHAIVSCTRLPAGEIDHGTIDFLLGLPVSRWEVFRSEAVAWLASAVFVVLCAAGGNAVGNLLLPVEHRLSGAIRAPILLNLLALGLALGSLASLVASFSDRRGRALGGAFAIFIASMLVTYLAQFAAIAKHLSVLSVLRYFQPMAIYRDGGSVADTLVLLAVAVTAWGLAGWVFARRDLQVT